MGTNVKSLFMSGEGRFDSVKNVDNCSITTNSTSIYSEMESSTYQMYSRIDLDLSMDFQPGVRNEACEIYRSLFTNQPNMAAAKDEGGMRKFICGSKPPRKIKHSRRLCIVCCHENMLESDIRKDKYCKQHCPICLFKSANNTKERKNRRLKRNKTETSIGLTQKIGKTLKRLQKRFRNLTIRDNTTTEDSAQDHNRKVRN